MVSFRNTECKGYAESNRSLSNRKNFIMTSLDFENLFSECMNLMECSSQHYRIFSVVPQGLISGIRDESHKKLSEGTVRIGVRTVVHPRTQTQTAHNA